MRCLSVKQAQAVIDVLWGEAVASERAHLSEDGGFQLVLDDSVSRRVLFCLSL